jgi:uncharacterized protein YprB with RNaseH-like and TPR domain
MLKSTFLHLQGVGKKTERALWQKGITTWDEYRCLVGKQLSIFDTAESDHADYYRIALTYPDETIFLDIETTGLSLYYDQLTIVGWSVGKEYGVYINGQEDTLLRTALENAKVIVTFNGTMFDLKFLHKTFKELYIPLVHLDLRFFSKRVGLAGGQKKIEKEIGFTRADNLIEMFGESAPILWHQYRRGDNKALKKLIEYNHADVEGMKCILDESIKRHYIQQKLPKNIRVKAKLKILKDQ